MRRVALRVALLGTIAAGCGQVLGADDYHVGATTKDAGTGGARASSDASTKHDASGTDAAGTDAAMSCDACLATDCAAELTACRADPTCSAALDCDLACAPGDLDCASLCAGRFILGERGIEPYALLACRSAHCASSCGLPCDGICLGNLGCDTCLAQKCGDEARTLFAAKDGPARMACAVSTMSLVSAATDVGDCETAVPEAATPWATWDSCRAGACASECSILTATPDFRCIEAGVPKMVAVRDLTTLDFDVRVILGAEAAPGANLQVRYCVAGTNDCQPRDNPPVTTSAGVAQLSSPRQSFGNFFDFVEIQDPSAAVDPTLFYSPPALLHPARVIGFGIPAATQDAYYNTAQHEFDRDRFGHVLIVAMSCGGFQGGQGLSVESDLAGAPYYFDSSVNPSFDLEQTTDISFAGFADVPAGTGRFTVRRVATNEVVSSISAQVRIGTVTNLFLPPSPPGGW